MVSVLDGIRKWLGRFFVSKAESQRRAAQRLRDDEKEISESERLDRLRNPSDYLPKFPDREKF